jgi:hypothetical protein
MGRRWTDQDIEQLKGMAQRYPAAKIAELTDRSMGAVAFKAHKLKLSLRSRREPESPDPSPSASSGGQRGAA